MKKYVLYGLIIVLTILALRKTTKTAATDVRYNNGNYGPDLQDETQRQTEPESGTGRNTSIMTFAVSTSPMILNKGNLYNQ